MYGSHDATEDVDAVVRQSEIAKGLALKVAKELGLPDDWLNDQVKQFLRVGLAPWRTSDDPIFDEGSTPSLRLLN